MKIEKITVEHINQEKYLDYKPAAASRSKECNAFYHNLRRERKYIDQ